MVVRFQCPSIPVLFMHCSFNKMTSNMGRRIMKPIHILFISSILVFFGWQYGCSPTILPPAVGLPCATHDDCTQPNTLCVSGVCIEGKTNTRDEKHRETKPEKSIERAVEPRQEAATEPTAEPALEPTSEPMSEPSIDAGPDIQPDTQEPIQPDMQPDAQPDTQPDTSPGTCLVGTKRPCYTGDPTTRSTGVCKDGEQICTKQKVWGPCTGDIKPSKEVCDNRDNNCDGTVDEGFSNLRNSCTVGKGECTAVGKIQCNQTGTAVECSARAKPPIPELCDGKDNDCDGKIDENFTQLGAACSFGKGACKTTGQWVCDSNKKNVICNAAPPTKPQKEVCDGQDNDCDGIIDNAQTGDSRTLTRSCYTGPAGTQGKGLCRAGTQTCQQGQWPSICNNEILPETKDTCDGQDRDCDGQVNNSNCGCQTGEVRACGSDVGLCQKGKQHCDVNGQWGDCKQQTKPTPEICDGKDNNCNGKIDENFDIGATCWVGQGGCARQGKKICDSTATSICDATPGTPEPEKCDGIDNDCDGQTDESGDPQSLIGAACQTPSAGVCKAGVSVCNNAQMSCVSQFQPSLEICRTNKDEDCDGQKDDICGPTYNYIEVSTVGASNNQRGFSGFQRLATGTYRLKPSTQTECKKSPLFLTAKGKYTRSIVWNCDGKKNYKVYTGYERKVQVAPVGNVLQNGDFYAVQPLSTDAYALVEPKGCGKNGVCQILTNNAPTGKITQIYRVGTGTYYVASTLCAVPWRPIFTSVFSDGTKPGFASAYLSSSHQGTSTSCYVRTYNDYGILSNTIAFAVWLPDPTLQKSAWATIEFTQQTNQIQKQNNFSDAFATWSTANVTTTNDCGGAAISCKRANVRFPSTPKAFIASPRSGGLTLLAVQPLSTSMIHRALLSSSDDTNGQIQPKTFNILFIQ